MVTPISNHSDPYLFAATLPESHQAPSTKQSQPPQDSVQLSAQAKAAAGAKGAAGDVDHDGDSH